MKHPVHDLPLSIIQLRVLDLASFGRSNAEIGKRLHLSEDTVKTHMRHAFRRLGARDRAHAVTLLYESRVFIPGQREVSK